MVHETLTEGGPGRLVYNHVQYTLICFMIVDLHSSLNYLFN